MSGETERTMADLRREAGEVLSQNGNRLLLIEGIAFSLLTVPMYLFFGYVFSALTEVFPPVDSAVITVIAIYLLLLLAITVFVTGPLLFGLFYMAYRMVKREDAVLADLFHGFSSASNYRQALHASAALVLRLCIAAVTVLCTYLVFLLAFPNDLPMMILCGVLITAEVIGGLLLCCSIYPLLFCLLEGDRSRQKRAGNVDRGLRFIGVFLPWLFLGVLTVGVLLIWDTFPRMLVAYFCDQND